MSIITVEVFITCRPLLILLFVPLFVLLVVLLFVLVLALVSSWCCRRLLLWPVVVADPDSEPGPEPGTDLDEVTYILASHLV